jgi:hypothetical protein
MAREKYKCRKAKTQSLDSSGPNTNGNNSNVFFVIYNSILIVKVGVYILF